MFLKNRNEMIDFIEELESGDSSTRLKVTMKDRNLAKFKNSYGIIRDAGVRDLAKFWGQKGGLITEPGKQIPENLHQTSYYINKSEELIIKSEHYELRKESLLEIATFCSLKGWNFEILIGIETHNPGATFSLVIETGLFLSQTKM